MRGGFGQLDYDNKQQYCVSCREYKWYSDFYPSEREKRSSKCRICRETQDRERRMAKFNGANAAAAAHIAKHVNLDVYKRMSPEKQIRLQNKLAYQLTYEAKTISGYKDAQAGVSRTFRKLTAEEI
jgi:hypothetical protein